MSGDRRVKGADSTCRKVKSTRYNSLPRNSQASQLNNAGYICNYVLCILARMRGWMSDIQDIFVHVFPFGTLQRVGQWWRGKGDDGQGFKVPKS